MKPRIYIETSVVSYASARLSRDLITASRQRITRRWLALRNSAYHPCISDLVLREAERGDAIAAQRRLRLCEEFPLLRITAEAQSLAARLIASNAVPKQEPETHCILGLRPQQALTLLPHGTLHIWLAQAQNTG